ncbi:hypothetical protein BDQ17DRAFT_1255299, partial [Cyathus striatus]
SIRTDEICTELGPGVIASNQVQPFPSYVDTRPFHRISDVCSEKHDLKLLIYGTWYMYCGEFLANAWQGVTKPDSYSSNLMPSQRKVNETHRPDSAWGIWDLFQSILKALKEVGAQHGSLSIVDVNVATRWVLGHPFVGAVLIGARLGISDHAEENKKVFSFSLTAQDNEDLENALAQSNSRRIISAIEDWGGISLIRLLYHYNQLFRHSSHSAVNLNRSRIHRSSQPGLNRGTRS